MKHASVQFDAIGTHWDIQIHQQIGLQAWRALQKQLHARIDTFDKAYSRFRTDSLVSQMARQAGTYELPADGHKMIAFYEQLYRITHGAITPLIGQVLADSGYDAAYSFASRQLSTPLRWEAALTYTQTHITLHQPLLLDFGAAGKGYLIDIISALVGKSGIEEYVINAGGDILCHSSLHTPWSVGLENPFDTSEALGIIKVTNQSICASAGSKRTWGNFHHIIDPHTLLSPDAVAATWVVATDTMTADGIATALFFTDAAELQKQFSFAYAILYKDMSLIHSKEFTAELFTMETTPS
jgi:thiamine biosynthesis lipoprotein